MSTPYWVPVRRVGWRPTVVAKAVLGRGAAARDLHEVKRREMELRADGFSARQARKASDIGAKEHLRPTEGEDVGPGPMPR
jgi:hypothetical protein